MEIPDCNCNVFGSKCDTIILDDLYCWLDILHATDYLEELNANKFYNLEEVLNNFSHNLEGTNITISGMGGDASLSSEFTMYNHNAQSESDAGY